MKLLKLTGIAALPLALCGCLEVNQHPAWLDGGYARKIDQLPYMQHFHNDRLAWSAALANRNLYQNEYVRAKPPGMAGAKRLEDTGATPAQNTGPAQPNPRAAGPVPRNAAGPAGATAPSGTVPAPAGMAAPRTGAAPAVPGSASPAASGTARPPTTR